MRSLPTIPDNESADGLIAAGFLNPLDPTDAREIVRRFLSHAADRHDPSWTALVLTALATLAMARGQE